MSRGVDLGAVREVLQRAGVRVGPLLLLSAGPTLVVQDGDRVFRLSRQSVDAAEDIVHLALQLAAAGAPVLLPIDRGVRETILGTVTLWEPATPSPEPESDLGRAIQALHRTQLPGVHARPTNRSRIKREVMQLEHHGVHDTTIDALRRIASRLPEEPGWVGDTGSTVLHGDAHRGNVMRRAGKPVLIDLEDVHYGPAQLDLLPTWCAARRSADGWWAWQQMRDAYRTARDDRPDHGDSDLWDWPHLEEAILERELMTTLFLCRRWREDPWVQDEVEHRVRTWEDARAVWNTGLRRS